MATDFYTHQALSVRYCSVTTHGWILEFFLWEIVPSYRCWYFARQGDPVWWGLDVPNGRKRRDMGRKSVQGLLPYWRLDHGVDSLYRCFIFYGTLGTFVGLDPITVSTRSREFTGWSRDEIRWNQALNLNAFIFADVYEEETQGGEKVLGKTIFLFIV